MELETLLDRLSLDRQAFAQFIHTLSFLEYLGSRKILKSQDAVWVSLEVLSHASEEIRHAKLFKKLAEEIAGHSLGGYCRDNLLCGEAAEAYFQAVDMESGRSAQGNGSIAYAITTLLVEERAMKFYPILEAVLSKRGYPGRVAGIIKEEERHLETIRAQRLDSSAFEHCRSRENEAFKGFLAAIGAGPVVTDNSHHYNFRSGCQRLV